MRARVAGRLAGQDCSRCDEALHAGDLYYRGVAGYRLLCVPCARTATVDSIDC